MSLAGHHFVRLHTRHGRKLRAWLDRCDDGWECVACVESAIHNKLPHSRTHQLASAFRAHRCHYCTTTPNVARTFAVGINRRAAAAAAVSALFLLDFRQFGAGLGQCVLNPFLLLPDRGRRNGVVCFLRHDVCRGNIARTVFCIYRSQARGGLGCVLVVVVVVLVGDAGEASLYV